MNRPKKHFMVTSSGADMMTANCSKWVVYQNWSDSIFPGYYLGDFSQGEWEYNITIADREEAENLKAIEEPVPDTLVTSDEYWGTVPSDFWTMWRLKIAMKAADLICEVTDSLNHLVIGRVGLDHVWCPKYHNNHNDYLNLHMQVNWKELRKWREENQEGFNKYFQDELAGCSVGRHFGDYIPETMEDLVESNMIRWAEIEYFMYTACSLEEEPFGSYYKYMLYDYVYSELRPEAIVLDCGDRKMRNMLKYVVYQK